MFLLVNLETKEQLATDTSSFTYSDGRVQGTLPAGTYCFFVNETKPYYGFITILPGQATTAKLTLDEANCCFLPKPTGERRYASQSITRNYGTALNYSDSEHDCLVFVADTYNGFLEKGETKEIIAGDDNASYQIISAISASDIFDTFGLETYAVLTIGETSSYLNIPAGSIELTGGEDLYSTDDKATWKACSGSSVSVSFAKDMKVWVKKGDNGVDCYLGTVTDPEASYDVILRHPSISAFFGTTFTNFTPVAGQDVAVILSGYILGSTYPTDYTFTGELVNGDGDSTPITFNESAATINSGISNLPANALQLTFKIPSTLEKGDYTFVLKGESKTGECSADNNETSVSLTIGEETSTGALKVYNSWGVEWPGMVFKDATNLPKGYYYIPFDRLKETKALACIVHEPKKYTDTLVASFVIDGGSFSSNPISLVLTEEDGTVLDSKPFLLESQYNTYLPVFGYPDYPITYDVSELLEKAANGSELVLKIDGGTVKSFSVTATKQGGGTKTYDSDTETHTTIPLDDIKTYVTTSQSSSKALEEELTRPLSEEEIDRIYNALPEEPVVFGDFHTGLIRPENKDDLAKLRTPVASSASSRAPE